jgi:hypothetical protein
MPQLDPGDHAWMASPSVLELEYLRVAAGHGKVVLYANSLPTGAGRERPMAWGGFPYVLDRDHYDEPATVRRAVATAALRKALWEEGATWRECIGPERFPLLVDLLTAWPRPRRVGCLASRRYAAERTLRERLGKLALPCPRDLMGWSLLLEAHFLVSLVHLSHRELAIHLGYGEARTLRRLSERLAGIPLGMLLQPGAFPQLAGSLRTRLGSSCEAGT